MYSEYADFAQDTALKAGKLLLKLQGTQTVVKQKDIQDIATTADIASEKLIISEITKTYPDHNIFSEENGYIDNKSHFTWVVDPLDGTKEYAEELPAFGVLIACQTNAEVVASCTHVPVTGESFTASKGHGAYESNKLLHISKESQISHASIYAHLPNNKLPEPKFSHMWKSTINISKHAYRLRGTWFDALALCYIAKGAIDGYCLLFDKGPKWHDIATGIVTLLEAGGKITDKHGKPLKHNSLENGLIASNGKIHNQLIKIINT